MHSKRIKHTTPQRKKRRALRRVKPRKGTLSFLLGLVALVVLLIIFAPGLELTPAANVSGTEILGRRIHRRQASGHLRGHVLQPFGIPRRRRRLPGLD